MEFKGKLRLSPENVIFNASKKNQYKGSLNQFYGRLQLKLDKGVTNIFSCVEDFHKAWANLPPGEEFDRVRLLGNRLYTSTEPRKRDVPKKSLESLCIQGAHIVAYARIRIHTDAMLLEKKGAKIYSIDTDAISFSSKFPPGAVLKIDNCIGSYKIVHQNVLRYSAMGSRRYSLEKNKDGAVKQVSVYAGLRSDFTSRQGLTSGVLKTLMQDDEQMITLETKKKVRSSETGRTHEVVSCMLISGAAASGRIIDSSSKCDTLPSRPYGYNDL